MKYCFFYCNDNFTIKTEIDFKKYRFSKWSIKQGKIKKLPSVNFVSGNSLHFQRLDNEKWYKNHQRVLTKALLLFWTESPTSATSNSSTFKQVRLLQKSYSGGQVP